MADIETLIDAWDEAHREFAIALEGLDDKDLWVRPHPRLLSIGELAAHIAATEARAAGIRWTFAPMVEIARDPRWGRIAEGAGEDPFLGAAMAAAYVRGFQGNDLSAPDSVLACAKHYAAYGAAEGGRDYGPVEMSEATLREVYLPPFHAAVDAGTGTLMAAFNSLNQVPATANRQRSSHAGR